MRVLIASDDLQLTTSQIAAYEACDCEVTVGVKHLYSQTSAFDIVHIHWPEELVGWAPPSSASLERLSAALDWWRDRSRIVATAHNLMPHRAHEHHLDRDLFLSVYSAADLIGHFSNYSRDSFVRQFPDIPVEKHHVHAPFLFPQMLQHSIGRAAARKQVGVRGEDFAVLIFGALRDPEEFRLVRGAIKKASSNALVTLFATHLGIADRWRRLKHRFEMESWRWSGALRTFERPVPDGPTAWLFEAADAVLIPRFGRHLNSGVTSLAMTFGTPLVVPSYGAYTEHLGGSRNAFYEPRNSASMAGAINCLARADGSQVRADNARIAQGWGWDKSVTVYLEARPKR